MAVVDPYSPCPCGSGQKYKWCCQKVEAYAERAQRLVDSGQLESALKPLSDGLAKVPANPWLSMRKALIELQLNQLDAAKLTLRELHRAHPDNMVGSVLLTRLVLETEGAAQGAAQLQQALSARTGGETDPLASLAAMVGARLAQEGFFQAALKHLELSGQLDAGEPKQSGTLLRNLKSSPTISTWEKNPYRLWPAPDSATPPFRESFERALQWANEGLWSSAASAFELLAAGSGPGVIAERNRGLCCLWIADHAGGVAALRRYIARTGPTIDCVDLEALCQNIDRPAPRDQVEFVHLSWPIRNRDGLLAALKSNKFFAEGPNRPVDPHDPKSAEVVRFFLLDRPRIEAKPGLTRQEIPVVVGEVLFSQDSVILETYDDGRLDRLIDRFTAASGPNIPPAHPRTKIIGKEQRHLLAMSYRWQLPEGAPAEDVERLNNEQIAFIVQDLWPETPNPALRWRTPLQAGRAGGEFETPLRAALIQLESTEDRWRGLIDWDQFRARLQLKAEPAIDPDGVNVEEVSLARLSQVPVERLDDDRALALYYRAHEWGVRSVVNRVAQLIDARPSLMVKGKIEAVSLYGELAIDAATRNDRAGALRWLARGRESETPLKRTAHEIAWQMIGVQLQMLLDGPETWVKSLAVIMDRYRGNREATSAIFVRLINLGLVQLVNDPNRPDKVGVDTRTLDYFLNQFGPRVTTASGELGVAAARGEIWTPESARPAGGAALWTPGSAPAPAAAGEKPKIIVTRP